MLVDNSKPSLPLPSAALAKPTQDKRKVKNSGQEKKVWNMKGVENVITRAKEISKRDITFSKKSKTDLLEALNTFDVVTDYDIMCAIRTQLSLCTDDTSYAIFGSQFASNFISSVRKRRTQDAAAKQKIEDKELGKQWIADFRAIWDDLSIDLDEWQNENTDCGDAWEKADELTDEARVYRSTLVKQTANASPVAEPRPTAEELFGRIAKDAAVVTV